MGESFSFPTRQHPEEHRTDDLLRVVEDIQKRIAVLEKRQALFSRGLKQRDYELEQAEREAEHEIAFITEQIHELKHLLRKSVALVRACIADLRSKSALEDLSDMKDKFEKMDWSNKATRDEIRKIVWNVMDGKYSEQPEEFS